MSTSEMVDGPRPRGERCLVFAGSSNRFLRCPANQDFDHLAFVLGRAAVVVHRVHFGANLSKWIEEPNS